MTKVTTSLFYIHIIGVPKQAQLQREASEGTQTSKFLLCDSFFFASTTLVFNVLLPHSFYILKTNNPLKTPQIIAPIKNPKSIHGFPTKVKKLRRQTIPKMTHEIRINK